MGVRQSQISKMLKAKEGLVAFINFYDLVVLKIGKIATRDELRKYRPFKTWNDEFFNYCELVKKVVDKVVESEKEIKKIIENLMKYNFKLDDIQLEKRFYSDEIATATGKEDEKIYKTILENISYMESLLNDIIRDFKKSLREEYKKQKKKVNILDEIKL